MKKTLQSFSQMSTLWLLIAASFSINLPVAFGSVSLGFFLIFWLISGSYVSKLALITKNPGALAALGLLGLYAIGVTYSSAPLPEAVHYLMKYIKFLVIPLVVGALVSGRDRRYALNAFLVSLIGYLIISYLNWFGLFSFGVMRHGTYMAFGAYLMLRNARRHSGQYRVVWSVLGALTVFNILFIADVRTGILTVFALLSVFALETKGLKGLIFVALLASFTVLIYKNIPETSNLRVVGIQKEINTKIDQEGRISSAGARFEMYRNTFTLIKKHPFFGGGTGSIETEYANLIKSKSDMLIKRVTNPHNQYLMTTQELGLVGLLVLFAFFGVHWWQSYQLEQKELGHILRALIISTMVGSLFNSLLLDSGDGRMYCILAGVLLSCYPAKES